MKLKTWEMNLMSLEKKQMKDLTDQKQEWIAQKK